MGRKVPGYCMLLEGIIEELSADMIDEKCGHKPENSVYTKEKKFSEMF
ncbi:MAG: hypothetical protein OIN84_20785 [Candidatus Methanoperedens sp.]|nr:hypothetical protein [Candidatus Methanoperedens sp. BLZ2]MBZ0176688.1 hypothetical protein [Candidatus Methanoperedens nitroreducens]MCX9080410.1 hypothetical protein [Candidatus Methanoperedens sp.]